MSKLTSSLKQTIVDDFGSFLAQAGFRSDGKQNDFYFYRRELPERYELVEVQIDKYHRPKFVINFGFVSKDGIIDPYGRLFPASEVRVAQLVLNGRLYRWPCSRAWFHVHTFFGLRSPEISVKSEIDHLIKLFQQVEKWFEAGSVGPNLSIYKDLENEPGVRRKSMQERGVWPPDGWTYEDEEAVKKAERRRLNA